MTKILGLMTCFNRKDKTVNAIAKLISENPLIQFSFIVADDNSGDGTREALQTIPNVKVLSGTGNLFYSGGMRLAMEKALNQHEDYDYCLLFNDDVDFYEGAIDSLIQKEKNVIWVGPTCDDEGHLSYGGVIKTSTWRPKFQIVKAETNEGTVCDTFNANCVLIPWGIFLVLGNMDSKYSHSLGDFDYGFFARKKGVIVKVSNQFVGVCIDNPTKGSWRDTSLSRKKRLQLKESPKGLPKKEWFYYLNKNYSLFTAIIYSIIPYVKIGLRK